MLLKKVVNKNIIAYDLYSDIMRNTLLLELCNALNLEEVFIDVYSVKESKNCTIEKLLEMGINIVYIPYKDGFQDWAIKINTCNIPILFTILSEYSFDEMTIWSCNECWEQHLFLKSARRSINIENESVLYLCYNSSEKTVELYLAPCFNVEAIDQVIKNIIDRN